MKKPTIEKQLSELLAMLPPKQAKFALHLAETDNASQSARAAGYSEVSERKRGCELRKKPVIQKAVELLRERYAQNSVWTAEDKMKKLQDIADKASKDGDSYSPSVSVQAIREHNAMTGDLAAIQVKHNHLNVDMRIVYDINMPPRQKVIESGE